MDGGNEWRGRGLREVEMVVRMERRKDTEKERVRKENKIEGQEEEQRGTGDVTVRDREGDWRHHREGQREVQGTNLWIIMGRRN